MRDFFRALFRLNRWSIAALFILILSIAVLKKADWRASLRALFEPPQRKVLSVAAADLFGTGKVNRVVKILTPEAILIEIYDGIEDHGRKLLETITLPDRRDARYHMFGQAINLALKDMDGDRRPEIVAPTYDDQMRPRLHVFKYNKENQRFEPYLGPTP